MKLLLAIVLVVCFAGIVYVIWPKPALAADCTTIGAAVANIEGAGGKLIDLVDIPGKDADQMLVIELMGQLFVVKVLAGCVLGMPVMVMEAKAVGQGV